MTPDQERARLYYQAHRKHLREYSRQYRAENKEKVREYNRQYSLKNREELTRKRTEAYRIKYGIEPR